MKTYLSSCSAFLLLSFISICNAGSYCSMTIGQPEVTPEDIAHYEQVYKELLTRIPPSRQSSVCSDDHKIIIEGATNIRKRLKEIETDASLREPRLVTINKEFKLHYDLSKDPSQSEEERSLASAKALQARAKLNIIVYQLTESDLELHGEIDDELDGMIQAARNLDASNAVVRAQVIEISEQSRAAWTSQDKLVCAIKDMPEKTSTEDPAHDLLDPYSLLVEAHQTTQALNEALEDIDLSTKFEKLREKVAQRRADLRQMQKVAESNLRILGMLVSSAAPQQESLTEVDKLLDEALKDSLSDPLGLDSALKPGMAGTRLIRPHPFKRSGIPCLPKSEVKTMKTNLEELPSDEHSLSELMSRPKK